MQHRLGIVMHGVTGRMGLNQHLKRSILAIRADGGVRLASGDTVMPDPLLLGRDGQKLGRVARDTGLDAATTDYEAALRSADHTVFFDAGSTLRRPELLRRAIEAGKHVYCEKPVGPSLEAARAVADLAARSGVASGVVMDKLFLPGLVKLRRLRDQGFFGRILSVAIDFGYWVFSGEGAPANRPSWNYRRRDGGGIIVDMMPHWRYVLDHVIAPVRSIVCRGATQIQRRWDEQGTPYVADADDAAYALIELDGGIVCRVASSWCTRVARDDLAVFQVDGTEGSAVAGLRWCRTQSMGKTTRPVWNPDAPQDIDFRRQWADEGEGDRYPNGFRAQWEQFIRHLHDGTAWPYGLDEGVKGVELADAAMRSWRERRWVDLAEGTT